MKSIILDGQTAEKTEAVCDENCGHYKNIRMSQTSKGHAYICLASETPLEMKKVGKTGEYKIGPVFECLYQKNGEEEKT